MTAHKAMRIARETALALRLIRHNLAQRLPASSLLSAAAACSIQNTPPGAAGLALAARLENLSPERVAQALDSDKTLLQTWTLRAAPHLFPTDEAQIFLGGLLPGNEAELKGYILGIEAGLALVGMQIREVVDWTEAAIEVVLAGRVVAGKQQLDQELAAWIEPQIPPAQQAAWRLPSLYGPNQTLGEAIVSFALRPAALKGKICFAVRQGRSATFARTEQWLGHPLPLVDPNMARAELARRYLGCYGPSSPENLAAWAGISEAQARGMWALIEEEIVEVEFEEKIGWLLAEEVDRLDCVELRRGIRFLPPHDPYLQARDKATLLPDPQARKIVWRVTGSPGVILVDGEIAATWRQQKKSTRLHLEITPLAPLDPTRQAEIAAEAQILAPFNGCTSVAVQFQAE